MYRLKDECCSNGERKNVNFVKAQPNWFSIKSYGISMDINIEYFAPSFFCMFPFFFSLHFIHRHRQSPATWGIDYNRILSCICVCVCVYETTNGTFPSRNIFFRRFHDKTECRFPASESQPKSLMMQNQSVQCFCNRYRTTNSSQPTHKLQRQACKLLYANFIQTKTKPSTVSARSLFFSLSYPIRYVQCI